jgi:hypothetical protein
MLQEGRSFPKYKINKIITKNKNNNPEASIPLNKYLM